MNYFADSQRYIDIHSFSSKGMALVRSDREITDNFNKCTEREKLQET